MKLNNEHREQLINELETALNNGSFLEERINEAKAPDSTTDHMVEYYTIKDFLNDKLIELIKNTLIENKADY